MFGGKGEEHWRVLEVGERLKTDGLELQVGDVIARIDGKPPKECNTKRSGCPPRPPERVSAYECPPLTSAGLCVLRQALQFRNEAHRQGGRTRRRRRRGKRRRRGRQDGQRGGGPAGACAPPKRAP